MAAKKPEPGPKPKFLVVEKHLKCQTDEGELSIDLRIPIERLELFMDMEDIPSEQMPKFIRDNVLWPEDREQILNLRDGADAFEILMKCVEEIGKRMGASLGESGGSSEPSESTGQPSDTTSETASDSA